MFWGVAVESGKKYSQIVETSYHLSMAALEPSNKKITDSNKYVSLMLEHSKTEFLLCTLEYNRVMQVKLELMFVEGEEVTFYLNGEGTVHLTGYVIDDAEPESSASEDSEEEMLDKEERSAKRKAGGDNEPSKGLKKLKNQMSIAAKSPENGKGAKSPKQNFPALGNAIEMDDDDDSDDDDFDADEDDSAADDLDVPSDSDVSEVSDAEEEDDSDDEEKGGADQDNGGWGKAWADKSKKDPKAVLSKKEMKKEKKGQQQQQSNERPAKLPQTPIPNNQSRSASFKQTPSGSANKKKEVESPKSADKSKSPKVRNLQGMTSEDLVIGNGPVAKKGKMVHVYYTGKLASNNKVFDSSLKGPPFSFKLGAGNVIKGWDLGVEGMKVGGKRTLTIPPTLGYGGKATGPIPGNSTLVFDVELKSVN